MVLQEFSPCTFKGTRMYYYPTCRWQLFTNNGGAFVDISQGIDDTYLERMAPTGPWPHFSERKILIFGRFKV